MAEKPIYVQVLPRLNGAGDSFAESGHLDIGEFKCGGELRRLDSGVSYDLVFSHTGEGVLLSGMARAKAKGTCSRCLTDVEYDVAGEVEGYYLFAPKDEETGFDPQDLDVLDPSGKIEICSPVMAAVVFDSPYLLLCRQDCKGLCELCGANLNDGPCGCQHVPATGKNNPFAALQGLFTEE